MTNKDSHNPKRGQIITDLQFEMKEYWNISEESTGIVATAFIGKVRKSLRNGSFAELCQELYDMCKYGYGASDKELLKSAKRKIVEDFS